MSERADYDPITANAVIFMRTKRTELGWSAQFLSDRCETIGAVHEPPIPNTLSRSRIAKLESGRAASLRIDEAYVLAGAFGISFDNLVDGDPDAVELDPALYNMGRPIPHDPMGERVRALERQMAQLVEILGQIGIHGLPETGAPEA